MCLFSKWVDTIKNIHEKHKPDYVPEFKSRLVSCGNFEDAEGVRTNAPTSDIEIHALVAVFAACHGVPLFSSDIKNAYFQAMPIDRIVIMHHRKAGLRTLGQRWRFLEEGRPRRQRGRTAKQPYFPRVLLSYRERRCGCCSHHAR